MGDQERGLFTKLSDKIHGVKTDSNKWDGNYESLGMNQQNNQQHNQQQNFQQNQSYPQYQNNQEYQQNPPQYAQQPNPNQNYQQQSYSQNYTPNQTQSSGPQNNQYPLIPRSQFNDGVLRFGSKIAIKHNNSGRFLFGRTDLKAHSGSGQQLAFLNGWQIGVDEEFQLLPATQQQMAPGTNITYQSKVRIKHLNSKTHLHSHRDFQSCARSGQEVSFFGNDTQGDENDDWIIRVYDGNQGMEAKVLHENDSFDLQHCGTNQFLFGCENGANVDDLREVGAVSNKDENCRWRVQLL